MSTHVLKTHPAPFQALAERRKRFEFRKNDREPPFEVGDWLHLQEWLPKAIHGEGCFTGRMIAARVSYIARGPDFDIPPGYAVMSLEEMTYYPRGDD
jgi:hypothetical protein